MTLKFPVLSVALLGVALGAAGPAPSGTPSSPDNETTALQPDNITQLGITLNSMGTTTNTGTPAQSDAAEWQPGSRVPPPNVLRPLGPEPPEENLPPGAPAPAALGPGPGHTLSGDFRGMSGAVNDTEAVPMNPYLGILGQEGKNTAKPPE